VKDFSIISPYISHLESPSLPSPSPANTQTKPLVPITPQGGQTPRLD